MVDSGVWAKPSARGPVAGFGDRSGAPGGLATYTPTQNIPVSPWQSQSNRPMHAEWHDHEPAFVAPCAEVSMPSFRNDRAERRHPSFGPACAGYASPLCRHDLEARPASATA